MKKMIEASWRGFDHAGEPDGGVERGYHLKAAPYATAELDVVIKNAEGEYAGKKVVLNLPFDEESI